MARRPHFLAAARTTRTAPGGLTLCINGPGRRLALHVELAGDSATRRRGLLGREALDENTAFIIAPSSAVHTFGMRFPIDVIFAARDGRVLKVRAGVPRSRMTFALRAFAVVEMAAGSVARSGLEPGDWLVLLPAAVPPVRPAPGP